MKIAISILTLCGLSFAMQGQPTIGEPFFGVEPADEPRLLAPELLASPEIEYNGTFSPDGKEFYYTVDHPENAYIAYTFLNRDNQWQKPSVASFSGQYADYDPLFSPDGKRLYFSSRRPPEEGISRIWYVERQSDGAWGPVNRVILTDSDEQEYYSSVTQNGSIYFNIWSTGKIFKGVGTSHGYAIQELPKVINDGIEKGDPFISPDEDYLIFRGYHKDGLGRGDLYISFRIDGQWTVPENLGEPINTSNHEVCPYVTVDGRFFIFASDRTTGNNAPYNNGKLNIFIMSADFISERRKAHGK